MEASPSLIEGSLSLPCIWCKMDDALDHVRAYFRMGRQDPYDNTYNIICFSGDYLMLNENYLLTSSYYSTPLNRKKLPLPPQDHLRFNHDW